MRSMNVHLDRLVVSPFNVRKTLDAGQEDAGIAELAESIVTHGLLSPLIVRPVGENLYEIIAGQRRYLACQQINLTPVPCLIREGVRDDEAIAVSLVENVNRAEMSLFDKATALKLLYERYGTYERVSRETGWSVQTIRKYLKLNELSENFKDKLNASDTAAGVGVLSRLADTFKGHEQEQVYEKISGFTDHVKLEILKQAKGNISIIDDLVDEAQEGIFDVRRCGGQNGCEIVQDILGKRMTMEEFDQTLQAAAARKCYSDAERLRLKDAAWTFWKALAIGGRGSPTS